MEHILAMQIVGSVLVLLAIFCVTSTCQFPTKGHPVDRRPHFLADPPGLEQVCLIRSDPLGNDSIYRLDGPLWMIASLGRLAQRVVEMVGK